MFNGHSTRVSQVTDRYIYADFVTKATARYQTARYAWFVKMLNVVFSANRKVRVAALERIHAPS